MRRPDSYTPSISPTADYPFGAYKDETSAGANDGTPMQRDQGMDSIQPWLLLLQDRGITVNNLPEVATNEQGLTALKQLIFESGSLQRTITADETLLDTEIYNTFNLNPNTASNEGLLTLIAPAAGINKPEKVYRAEHGVDQGLCRVDANGAQRFDFKGNTLQYILLYTKDDFIEFYWNTNKSKWSIKDYKISMPINAQGRSGWANVHMGNGVTYDNKSSAVDFTGMVITESSGFTGVVVEDDAGTGTSGILYVYELSSNFTFWTNNNVLTASDGTTADVNEVSGTSKNIDYAMRHGFGIHLWDFSTSDYISSDQSGTGARELPLTQRDDFGNTKTYIDNNSYKNQTGLSGILLNTDAGANEAITSNDLFINTIVNI